MTNKEALERFKALRRFYDDRLAIAVALEKQMPKKPKVKIYKYPYEYTDVRDDEYDLVCPCCGEHLVEDDHYCECGQRILWEE